MKREGNLYNKICSIENLIRADKKARKKKHNTVGVKIHDKARGCNILLLHNILMDEKYKTSEYKISKIYDPKERDIYKLKYYPDRITHHAIMFYLEEIWVNIFTSNTYACIKGRGVHSALKKIKRNLKSDIEGTKYCLQIDIKKFYPSIDHKILKKIIRKKIKDKRLLKLLDEIISSIGNVGVPIGNYLSQYFANLYLAYFDHWLKEEMKVKYCYRYSDDVVIFSNSKEFLHSLFEKIESYLKTLKLEIKGNYKVFPSSKGIDFLGYVVFPEYSQMRKRNKKAFAKAISKGKSQKHLAGYLGWAKHCDSKHLLKKLLKAA